MRCLEERVIVATPWSSFRGQRGRVTQVKPYLMVLLDGETKPIAFGTNEVFAESSERHVGGAE